MTGGDVVETTDGRCGRCGCANFSYANGREYAADGTRGYRCVSCGGIKREDWRIRMFGTVDTPVEAPKPGDIMEYDAALDPNANGRRC